MQKKLLKSKEEYYNLIRQEYYGGHFDSPDSYYDGATWLPKPIHFPCLALYDFQSDNLDIEFVYMSDFGVDYSIHNDIFA